MEVKIVTLAPTADWPLSLAFSLLSHPAKGAMPRMKLDFTLLPYSYPLLRASTGSLSILQLPLSQNILVIGS